jgi:alpha-L-fucosidase
MESTVGSITSHWHHKLTSFSYPAESTAPPAFVYKGVKFSFPVHEAAGNDNVLAQEQRVNVPRGRYFSVSMLAVGETELAAGSVNASHANSSNSSTIQPLSCTLTFMKSY